MHHLTRLKSGLVTGVLLALSLTLVVAPAKATTAISGCNNQSLATVVVINREHTADSAYISPNTYAQYCYMWIPQNTENPVSVQTGRGNIIWDKGWKIRGKWDDGSAEFVLSDVPHNQTDYKLVVESTGNVHLETCKSTGQGNCDK
jgi:hypothetical protein